MSITKTLNSSPAILQIARFAAIGGLNTALDFLLLNWLARSFDIPLGGKLGIINIISFSIATIHSYIWNKAWTFSTINGSVWKILGKSFALGSLAGLGLLFAVFAKRLGVESSFMPVFIFLFLGFELLLWFVFSLRLQSNRNTDQELSKFLLVSLIGLGINSGVVAGLSVLLSASPFVVLGVDMLRNLSKAAATGISLVWNFLGYKILVFKK